MFFFDLSGLPLKPHSFPTRRSSDLKNHYGTLACGPDYDECRPDAASGFLVRARSEEHTSELQSHHDLVCRLLLENKRHRGKMPTHPRHARGRATRYRVPASGPWTPD